MANTYKSYFVDLTTTDKTTIYTVPANTTSLVKTIQLSNDTGNPNITVHVTDSSSSTEYEIAHITMSSKSTNNFAFGTIVLEANDILKIQSSDANTITGIVSLLEISFK